MHSMLSAAAFATLIAAGMPAHATPASAPASAAASATRALHRVDGFRSAHWGLDETGVRAAIAHDFPASAGTVRPIEDAAGTRALTVHVAHLDPGPGGAELTYILDRGTQQLAHVNVVWSTGATPDAAERGRMAGAAAQLANYFHRQAWQSGAATQRLAADASFAVVFVGVDPQAAAVEVRLSGVVFERPGLPPSVPTGPAVLRVAYFATIATEPASAPGAGGR
jgi:hypothetical protein